MLFKTKKANYYWFFLRKLCCSFCFNCMWLQLPQNAPQVFVAPLKWLQSSADCQHVDFCALSALSSTLPQDHPQGHQTLQPAAGGRRSRQDRGLWSEQHVRGGGRPPVEHGGDAGLHGPRNDDRTRAELQWKGETRGHRQLWSLERTCCDSSHQTV